MLMSGFGKWMMNGDSFIISTDQPDDDAEWVRNGEEIIRRIKEWSSRVLYSTLAIVNKSR